MSLFLAVNRGFVVRDTGIYRDGYSIGIIGNFLCCIIQNEFG